MRVKTQAFAEFQKWGLLTLPLCLNITHIALYITFCSQSTSAAEPEYVYQLRISGIGEGGVLSPKFSSEDY